MPLSVHLTVKLIDKGGDQIGCHQLIFQRIGRRFPIDL
jgi:hypothetical protein